MKIRLADSLLQKLSELGQAIDIDRQAIVFDGGEVGIIGNEQKENESESEGTRGSSAGSREWAEAGSWRAAGEASRIGRIDEQAAGVEGLDNLSSAYPAIIKFSNDGLWIIVMSKPLGRGGPQVTFVVAYPYLAKVEPRAWGFWKLGEFPKFIGPRHTNFPDASICAFGPDDGAWKRADGVVALLDLYSTWVIRQLYFQHFDRWPGRQHGASALYRRTEFSSEEWCGCGSGLRYGQCHEVSDKLLSEDEAREQHRQKLGSDYGPRKPPKSVIKFIRSGWSKIPSLKDAYEHK